MSTFYGHLVPYPLESFGPEDFLPLTQYYSGSAVLVNLRGERVADETLGDEILNQALTFEPEARGVLIFDERVREVEARKEIFPGFGAGDRFEGAVRAGGTATSAATLEALLATVATWGVDERRLSATVHEYLHVAGSGGGFAHGIAVSPHARPPRVAPFHALMVQPSITFTFGGIRVGLDGEVLDSDERAIPGLFACGVDVGGLSNYGYVGGLAPSYITGRAAGAAAARYSQRGSATEPRKESR